MAKKERKYNGMKLYPWQKDVTDYICNARGTGKVCVVKAPRQRGKSYMCEGILLHYAINYSKSTSAMISPTLAQSRKIFKEIVNAIYPSGIIKKKNETLLEIELINNSIIFFKSSEMGDALRGFKVDGILIWDEAAYLTEDILELCLPWRQVSNAPLLLVSTPKTRNGVFYSYWSQGFGENKTIKSIDWCEYDTSALITEDMIKQFRKVMTKNQFRTEILGLWLDDDGMVFSNIYDNATSEEYDTKSIYTGFYAGIDFGSGDGNDYTSLTVFDDNKNMVFLDYFNDLGTFEQVDRLINDLKQFSPKIKSIYAENNSIGSPFIDIIIKECQKQKLLNITQKLERWTTTNSSKAKLVRQLQLGLEQNECKLLNNKMLLNQLSSFESEYNQKTGVTTYNGAYGTHDDLCVSTMLAWYALNQKDTVGQYCIGVARKYKK